MERARLGTRPEDYERLGIGREPHPREDGIRTAGGKGSFEWWYFDAEYADGAKGTVVFYTKNGFDVNGPAWPLVQLDLTLPDGTVLKDEVRGKKGTVIDADRDGCRVAVNGCRAERRADGVYEVRYENPAHGICYEFTLTPTCPMWRPETSHIFFGDGEEHFFAWFVGVPRGRLQAVLTAGGETRSLEGSGYHDHNWGNCAMTKLLNHWYWCRASLGDYTVIDCDIVTSKAYGYVRIPIFLVARDGEILSDHSPVDIVRGGTHPHSKTGKFMDDCLTFHQRVGETNWTVEYRRQGDIYSSFLAGGPFKQTLARLAGLDPTYVRCVGQVKLTRACNDGSETVEDQGLWEQMGFGKEKTAPLGPISQAEVDGDRVTP